MTPFVQDADFTLYVGDVREQLRELEAESVHCVVTSPPYWGLRDYGTGSWVGGNPECDHDQRRRERDPDSKQATSNGSSRDGLAGREDCRKCGASRTDQQLGLEATPDLFVAAMVDVFREVRRVLRTDGTCWVNLGDSYNANQGAGFNGQKRQDHANRHTVMPRPDWLKPKDLVGIPWRVAFALQADGWYLRSDIVWAKPNPMPESVTDRPTKAHEYVFLLTKSPRYFFDQEAVRETASPNTHSRGKGIGVKNAGTPFGEGIKHNEDYASAINGHVTARNVRTVWEIATQPYPEAHFATFPEALPERCIKAGTSERGCCPECGAPWARETEHEYEFTQKTHNRTKHQGEKTFGDRSATMGVPANKVVTTTGWVPSCECGKGLFDIHTATKFDAEWTPRPCTVLDPFMGSGTTALVARKLGRRSIGIELNPEYAALCARRLQQLSLEFA